MVPWESLVLVSRFFHDIMTEVELSRSVYSKYSIRCSGWVEKTKKEKKKNGTLLSTGIQRGSGKLEMGMVDQRDERRNDKRQSFLGRCFLMRWFPSLYLFPDLDVAASCISELSSFAWFARVSRCFPVILALISSCFFSLSYTVSHTQPQTKDVMLTTVLREPIIV